MPIKQFSKIQVRSGEYADLPQLAIGELGWATDQRRLFVGNDPASPGPHPTPDNTEILTTLNSPTPGGSNTQIQYNNNGLWGGIPTVTYDGVDLNLGSSDNVKILGGTSNQILKTDGSGNLSWTNNNVSDVFAYPEDYGAVGNGTTNDSVAIQAALNTGKNVFLSSGKVYYHTSTLNISTSNQWFGGPGILKTNGAINSVNVGGGTVGVQLSLNFDSPGQISGYAIYISNANRVVIQRANIVNGFGAVYVENANTVNIEWLWASLSGPGIKWYGNDTTRSDVLSINFALMDIGPGYYGMDWDGNCHSLNVKYLGLVCGTGTGVGQRTSNGMIIRNTAGVISFPAIGRIGQVEVDYALGNGIEIQAGLDYDFSMPYVLGASGDGIRIGSSVNSYEVRITGGKFVGNDGYGINNLGGMLLFGGATALYSNVLGSINGDVRNLSSTQSIDTNYNLNILSNNPQINFDTTDYISYSRSTNELNVLIGGAASFIASTLGTQSPIKHVTPNLELGTNYYISTNASNPIINFDANDALQYGRSTNQLDVIINSSTAFTVSNSIVQSYKPVILPNYTVATLPTGQLGMKAFVSDATTTTFASNVVGGGSNKVPVYHDGTAWKIG
jgi:hypothetical protein